MSNHIDPQSAGYDPDCPEASIVFSNELEYYGVVSDTRRVILHQITSAIAGNLCGEGIKSKEHLQRIVLDVLDEQYITFAVWDTLTTERRAG